MPEAVNGQVVRDENAVAYVTRGGILHVMGHVAITPCGGDFSDEVPLDLAKSQITGHDTQAVSVGAYPRCGLP